ncbi:MAG: hypothetical protein V3V08_02495 [Nannocystaceae bacterium]
MVSRPFASSLLIASILAACGRTWPPTGGADALADDTGPATASGTASGDTVAGTSSPAEGADSTSAEPEPEELGPSCRQILGCLAPCMAQGGDTAGCLATCGEGANPSQVQLAAGLMGCVAINCFQSGDCTSGLQDSACVTCIGVGMVLPSPPGCEDEAAACV